MSEAAAIKLEPFDLNLPDNLVDNDNDELVREIDVYISPELSEQLYLMQYPLSHNAPFPSAARIKKKHTMIELEHEIPKNIGSGGNFSLATLTQNSHIVSVSTHMAMGKIMDDGALHLLPLYHITQMRPDFSHVDAEDQQLTQTAPAEDQTLESAAPEKKPVLFQKKESERAALARKSSYSYKKASEDGEEWLELSICPPQSPEYNASQHIILSQKSNTLLASSSCQNFVASLDYLPPRNDGFDDAPSHEGSSHLIKVVKRLTTMLHRGVPVTYSAIRPQFPTDTLDDVDLLTCLNCCAVMVRGNWYLQSRFCMLDPPLASTARSFILFLLETVGHVQRRGLEGVFSNHDDKHNDTNKNNVYHHNPNSDWIETILRQVAVQRLGGRQDTYYWFPRLADNVEFALMFPETTQLHKQFWERQRTRFETLWNVYLEHIVVETM